MLFSDKGNSRIDGVNRITPSRKVRAASSAASVLAMLLYVGALTAVPEQAQAQGGGVGAWCSSTGAYAWNPSNCIYASAQAACNAFGGGSGALSDLDTWRQQGCRWTTGSTSGAASVYFTCQSGLPVYPNKCVVEDFGNPKPSDPDKDRCAAPSGGTTAHPIDILTGAKLFDETDFIAADGALGLRRLYSSAPLGGAGLNAIGPVLGLANWSFNFQYELQITAGVSAGLVTLVSPSRGQAQFIYASTGVQAPHTPSSRPNPQTDYKLSIVGSGPTDPLLIDQASRQWTMTDAEDNVWTFQSFLDPTLGDYKRAFPISVSERSGGLTSFAYDTNGKLLSMTDAKGKTVTFDWVFDSDGITRAISAAHLPGGYTIAYSYDLGGSANKPYRLSTVQYKNPSNVVLDAVTYLYGNTGLPLSITEVKDKSAVTRWSVTYDSNGRAVTSSGPSGVDSTTVAYSAPGTTFTRTVTNALGKQATYNYTRTNTSTYDTKLVGVTGVASTNCPSSARSNTYGVDRFVASSVDEEGRTTGYTWNSRALPTQVNEAVGTTASRTTNTTWHSTFRVPTQIQRPGQTIDFVYDTAGRPTSITQTDTTTITSPYVTNGRTRTWGYTWNASGQLLTINGPLAGTGDTQTFTYNSSGFLQTYTNEVGQTMTVTAWDWRGAPTTVVDANAVSTTYTYNIHGQPLTVTINPGAAQSQYQFAYNDAGDVSQITLPGGGYIQYTYNTGRQLTLVTNNRGETQTFTNNAMGSTLTAVTKNSSATVTRQMSAAYDELNRAIRSIGAAGVGTQLTTMTYDKVNNPKSLTDPLNHVRSNTFDALNRLITETDPASNTNQYTYNGQDQATGFKDGLLHQTTFVVDGFGQVIQETNPDRGVRKYWYSAAGKLTKLIDGDLEETNFTYDNAGRMTGRTFPGATAETMTYTYDQIVGGNKGIGRLTSVTSGGAISGNALVYDAQGRITRDTQSIYGHTLAVNYAYDNNSKLTQVTYPSGRILTLARATDGLVTGVTMKANSTATSQNVATSVTYAPFGPLKSLTYGNGLNLSRTFDQNYWMTRIEVKAGATTSLDLGFQYYDDGRMGEVDDNAATGRTTYISYKNTGKLEYAGGPWGNESYDYDAAGNRIGRYLTVGSTNFAYNGILQTGTNRMVEIHDAANVITRQLYYRDGGDLAEDNYAAGDNFSFSYDGHKRLVSTAKNGTDVGHYGYDDAGRRVWRETFGVGASTTIYVFDRSGHLLAEHDDATGNPLKEYVWIDDLPVAVVDYTTGTATTYYIHAGQMDEPLVLTNASKSKVWDAYVNPWGKAQTFSAATAKIDLRLPGQWLQIEANGLHQNHMRDYDPSLGRYVQADPLGLAAGQNLYEYAFSDPFNLSDPTGRFVPLVTGAIGAGLGGIIDIAGQLVKNNQRWACIDWGQAGVAAGVGFGAGALAPFVGTTYFGATALSVAANLAQYAGTNMIHGQAFDAGEASWSAGAGVVGGLVGGKFSRVVDFDTSSRFLNQSVARTLNSVATAAHASSPASVARSTAGAVVSATPQPSKGR